MKPFRIIKKSPVLKWFPYFLSICILLFVWIDHIYFASISPNPDVFAENRSNEFAPEKNPVGMCTPHDLPLELKMVLLNDPQSSGDVAEFEFEIKSLIEFDNITAYFIIPEGAIRITGTNWAGVLSLNESKQLQAGIRLNTEDAITLLAVVEVTKDDSIFIFKKAYHLDLGEKEYAALEDLSISGFTGADSLNLIVPKP